MTEREIFTAALAKENPEQRAAFLDDMCKDDPSLRRRIESLLAEHQQLGSFMDVPSAEPPATLGHSSVERAGAHIGPYKLLQQIGEGGMGTVFMAEQTAPVRRRVALKIIKPGMDTRQVIARFEAEKQVLALMDHANIARVLDAGTTEGGRPYFVMELVQGLPITKYCDDNRLTPRQRLELFAAVCQAIQHAHTKGIIHRDIKPTNVMVTRQDGQPVVKVIDFGIAKAMGQQLTEKTLYTNFAQMIGTPLYMSPEQAELSSIDIDTRSDIYSLGVLLYELLTGSTPVSKEQFKQAAFDEIRRIIREDEPPKPSTRISSAEAAPSIAAQRHTEPVKLTRLVRGELDWIVMKALEKDRSRRYETASGFAADVQRYLADEPVQACPPSAAYRFRKFARRNKRALVSASIIGVALLLAVGTLGWAVRDRSAREHEVALERTERQTKVAAQVESIMAEVERLESAQKWPEALAAARRAEAVVSGGEVDVATTQRVSQRMQDIQLIELLEQIRMQRATTIGGLFDNAGTVRQYAQAFRDYGVDVASISAEASVAQLTVRAVLAMPLAAALDDWAHVQKVVSKEDAASWQRLVTVARGIDPDPMRDRFRSTWDHEITAEEQDELLRLAESLDIQTQQPATILQLVSTLKSKNLSDSALKLLQDAQLVYRGDFWLNLQLGYLLASRNDWNESIRFYTAAAAIRPDSAAALWHLGYSLDHMSHPEKLDEAVACFQMASKLDPTWARGYRDIGNVLNHQGKSDKAIAAYRRAIEVDPQSPFGYQGLGSTIWNLANHPDPTVRNPQRAIELGTEFVEARPQSCELWQYLGWCQYVVGNWQASIEALERSCQLQEGGVGDCGQWIVLCLAHAKRAEQESLTREEREHHKLEARRRYLEADNQINTWGTGRPTETRARTIWDFRMEAWALIGPKGSKYEGVLPSPAVRLESARLFAEKRDWKLAAAELDVPFEQLRCLGAGLCYFSTALLRLLVGDVEGYAQLAQTMPAASEDPFERMDVLRILTIHPRGSSDPAEILRRARAAYDETKTNWTAQNLGMAHYRAGNFEEALRWMEESQKLHEWHLFFPALAMTHHQLGHADEARQWLAKAEAVFADVTANDRERLDVLQGDPYWQDWAYFEVMLLEAKQVLPSAGVLLEAARPFAEKRDWKRAASELEGPFEQQRSGDGMLYFSTALLRLLAGDVEGYAQLALSQKPSDRLDFLRVCTIHPRGSSDPAEIVRLARAAYDEARNNNWNAQNLGMAHYRAGDFEEALRWMEESQKLHEWYLFFPALAMTHHKLGHADEARKWLAKAETFFADVTTGSDGQPLKTLQGDPFWQDWAYFEVMLQEAKKVVGAETNTVK